MNNNIDDNMYQRGKIYKIVCNTTGLTYFGSTCEKALCNRLSKHKYEYNQYLNDKTRCYLTSFEIFTNDNYQIVLVENYPCENKDDLFKRERFHIENNDCVNRNIPGRTDKEYYIDNKEHLKEKSKNYYHDNKEVIGEKVKVYYENNKKDILDYHKEYYKLNKEEMGEKQKIRNEKNKENIKLKKHEYYLKTKDKKREYDRLRRERMKQQKNSIVIVDNAFENQPSPSNEKNLL